MFSTPRELPDRQLEDVLLGGARAVGIDSTQRVAQALPAYAGQPEHRQRCLNELMACASELRRREQASLAVRTPLGGVELAKQYVVAHFSGEPIESFVVLFLDISCRLIGVEEMFRGTLSQTAVYPREVARRALANNASAVIVSHNHPSGLAEPSRADEYLTATLKSALSLVDVKLLDHLVVSGETVTSFAERGLL